MNNSFESLCSKMCCTVLAASVGYNGTETWPAIQIAQSAIIQCALFLASIAILLPGSKFRLFRCAAMRRVSAIACFHVQSLTTPPPIGWVRATLSRWSSPSDTGAAAQAFRAGSKGPWRGEPQRWEVSGRG